MSMTITTNVSDVMKNLMALAQASREGAAKAVEFSGVSLIQMAVHEGPTIPLKDGPLSQSAFLNVNNERKDTGIQGSTGELHSKLELVEDVHVAQPGFDKRYAAYQHEGVRADGSHVVKNYTTPGSGKKFLEIPLYEQDFIPLQGEVVRTHLRRAT